MAELPEKNPTTENDSHLRNSHLENSQVEKFKSEIKNLETRLNDASDLSKSEIAKLAKEIAALYDKMEQSSNAKISALETRMQHLVDEVRTIGGRQIERDKPTPIRKTKKDESSFPMTLLEMADDDE